jgi:hypothetical protein
MGLIGVRASPHLGDAVKPEKLDMSRSGYTDDCEYLGLYRGNVARSIKSRRGQEFLRELAAAMDAMPEKVLIVGDLINEDDKCCTLGVVCDVRGLDVAKINPECPRSVGEALGISRMMAAEIAYENDEGVWNPETGEQRWQRMRQWVAKHLLNHAT